MCWEHVDVIQIGEIIAWHSAHSGVRAFAPTRGSTGTFVPNFLR
jgi:hypothetical protein